MINKIKNNTQERMEKSVETLKDKLAKIRTGRAHPSLLFGISIEYYGAVVPLNQVGNIVAEDSRTLTITVFDKDLIVKVERAILESELGLNPMSSGTTVRVPLPPLTEERRKHLVKLVRSEAENTRIAIRNIRREANSDLKVLLRDRKISEDVDHKTQEKIQKMTDLAVKKIDTVLILKEKDLMEV
ncbi:ribosome-recycling factor [Candidatus Photodesmus blepharus]|uniref:Ribosome-recycling factor n=1 Tax=Candidatus Photodesmus blepharonis TaxID=1179155 RepID=A0A084CNX7_9GAMM|nr:ribosome recycling factor [Candidatus Photodesmus blepharus]KEY91506.1 ribosome-recycling factor [Candidatus Photodesmus blepharus]